eukprot:7247111-Ditylum_brightwellii.AAC.1
MALLGLTKTVQLVSTNTNTLFDVKEKSVPDTSYLRYLNTAGTKVNTNLLHQGHNAIQHTEVSLCGTFLLPSYITMAIKEAEL